MSTDTLTGTTTDGSQYLLTAIMENIGSDEESKCVDVNNWAGMGCTSGDTYNNASTDVCYAVENP